MKQNNFRLLEITDANNKIKLVVLGLKSDLYTFLKDALHFINYPIPGSKIENLLLMI